MVLARKKVVYYVRGQKTSLREAMFVELTQRPPNVSSNLIGSRCIAAEGHF